MHYYLITTWSLFLTNHSTFNKLKEDKHNLILLLVKKQNTGRDNQARISELNLLKQTK